MKLCIDCKYHKKNFYESHEYNRGEIHYCHKDAYIHTDPVTGRKSELGIKYCSEHRKSLRRDRCGEEGKFWEPRTEKYNVDHLKSLWQLIWKK